MTQDASGEYLRNAINTATPEQLHLMLLDGAVRFCKQAKEAMRKKDLEISCEKLIRAQRIVVQLQNGLRPDVNAELCEQMNGLYNFIYNRLVDANLKRDTSLIDEALTILESQRETWRMLIDKLQKEVSEKERKSHHPGAPATVGATSPAKASPKRTPPKKPDPSQPPPESGGSFCVEG